MTDIKNLRIGSASPSSMLFGASTERICESKFDFTAWTKVDGAGDIDVTTHKIVIRKFKPNTMLMRSESIAGTPNTAICAACAGMKLSVSGIDANSAVFSSTQTLTNNHGAGSDLPKAQGLCFYPGTTDGYLMMERMYTWEKCWSDADTRDLSPVADWQAFRHGSGHGQYGWRKDVANEVNIPAELYDFPNWDKSNGKTSVTWCMMFGLYTGNTDVVGDDGLIDVSDNPITITEGVAVVDPCSVECWDVYHGDEQVYHKDKTYANCWKKYGFESKSHAAELGGGVFAKIYNITADNYPEADEIYVPPITDIGTGSGLTLYPCAEVDGVFYVRSFNIAPYNKEFWTAIKEWYASHEIEAQLLAYALPADDDGVMPYSLFEKCGIDELTLNLTSRNSEFKSYGSTNVPFQGSQIEKLTLNGDVKYTSMCNFFKGARNLTELTWNLPTAGAKDCSGMFAYGNKMTTYPANMIDWSYRKKGVMEYTPIPFAFDYHSCIEIIPQYSESTEREDDHNTIISGLTIQQFLNGCDSLTAIMPVLNLLYVVPTGTNVYNALVAPNLSDARIKNLNNGDWHLDGSKYDSANGYVTGNLKSLDAESIAYLFDNLVDLPNNYKEDNVNTPSTCFLNDSEYDTTSEDYAKEAWVDKTLSIGETLSPYSVSRDNVKMSIRHAANTIVSGTPQYPHLWTYAAFSMDVKVTGMQANDKLYIGSTEITADGTYTVSNEQGTACYISLIDTSLDDDATSTDATNTVQVTIADAYDPSKSVVKAASLYCPSEWEESYDAVSGNDFDTLVNSANSKGWTVFVGGTERVVT